MTRIVVGVDGSRNSRRALRRALEEAELRDGIVEVVHVYDPPEPPFSESLMNMPIGVGGPRSPISTDAPAHHPPSPAEEAQERATARLEQIVSDTLGAYDAARVQLVATPHDDPAEAIVNASLDADLLVIGTRGLGGIKGLLLGSVARHCIQHCRRPMLILPPLEH